MIATHIGEDPAAHGHWCAFTDLYHTMPYIIKSGVKEVRSTICVFEFLLIETSSRKAVPEVTSTSPGPLHYHSCYKK